jgi:mono/diheme cytochrome c family protein
MSTRGLVVTLLALCAALGITGQLLRPDPDQRNFELFPDMARSPAAESQSPSTILPGGLTSQHLPEGVVVRGSEPFPFGTGPEEAARAGSELVNPLERTGDTLARGAELYRSFCVVCHGADGNGGGPVVLRGLPPPPSLLGARARQIADGEIYHVLTRGQGTMASYALQLAPTQRWQVIQHVRALQEVAR